eukprot:TRINITY_DN8666_c0_g1_i3.p1 TRINITY_DN8666_c0_g1~~TRINITY_DN8666_c0_g1_i3.p1  ORF type:complete len:841 (+),score=116.06 TRINITY_DN8666_c0_g1_i3:44-2566(+)
MNTQDRQSTSDPCIRWTTPSMAAFRVFSTHAGLLQGKHALESYRLIARFVGPNELDDEGEFSREMALNVLDLLNDISEVQESMGIGRTGEEKDSPSLNHDPTKPLFSSPSEGRNMIRARGNKGRGVTDTITETSIPLQTPIAEKTFHFLMWANKKLLHYIDFSMKSFQCKGFDYLMLQLYIKARAWRKAVLRIQTPINRLEEANTRSKTQVVMLCKAVHLYMDIQQMLEQVEKHTEPVWEGICEGIDSELQPMIRQYCTCAQNSASSRPFDSQPSFQDPALVPTYNDPNQFEMYLKHDLFDSAILKAHQCISDIFREYIKTNDGRPFQESYRYLLFGDMIAPHVSQGNASDILRLPILLCDSFCSRFIDGKASELTSTWVRTLSYAENVSELIMASVCSVLKRITLMMHIRTISSGRKVLEPQDFWFDSEAYGTIVESTDRRAKGMIISKQYIEVGSPSDIGLDEETRKKIQSRLEYPYLDTFKSAQDKVMDEIKESLQETMKILNETRNLPFHMNRILSRFDPYWIRRNILFKKTFGDRSESPLLGLFSCSYDFNGKTIHGLMGFTDAMVGFGANIFGYEFKLVIPMNTIQNVEPVTSNLVFRVTRSSKLLETQKKDEGQAEADPTKNIGRFDDKDFTISSRTRESRLIQDETPVWYKFSLAHNTSIMKILTIVKSNRDILSQEEVGRAKRYQELHAKLDPGIFSLSSEDELEFMNRIRIISFVKPEKISKNLKIGPGLCQVARGKVRIPAGLYIPLSVSEYCTLQSPPTKLQPGYYNSSQVLHQDCIFGLHSFYLGSDADDGATASSEVDIYYISSQSLNELRSAHPKIWVSFLLIFI